MKIAIVCPNYPPAYFEGGIAHYSRLLADHLKLRGHQVFVITSSEYSYSNVKGKESEAVQRIFIRGPWNHNSIEAFKKVTAKEKIDALILQYSPSSFKITFRIKWAISKFSCNKITAFHTLWGEGFDRIIGVLNLIGTKKIVATNSEIMSILKKRLPFLLKKTYWIPIGSNIPNNFCKETENLCDSKLISYFGMLYSGKGLDLILDVLEGLNRKNYNYHFKFIGGGMLNHESYEKAFLAKIKQRNLSENVSCSGLISENEVSKWLIKSRFVFLPYERGLSDRRGSLMAAIEHGKAVLTAPPAVAMHLFKNGENILWPKHPTLNEYIKLSEKMLNDDELISRLEKGAEELSNNFRWQKIATAYESALL